MIIKLTHYEMKRYVGRALDIPVSSFTLEIETLEPDLLVAFRTAIREFPGHAYDQKISCIKRFRELAPRVSDPFVAGTTCVIGLADAKWAVENSSEAISNLTSTGRIK